MVVFLYQSKKSVLIQLQKLKRDLALSDTEVEGISSGFKRTLKDIKSMQSLNELADCSNFQDYLQIYMTSATEEFWMNSRNLAGFYYANLFLLLFIVVIIGLINLEERHKKLPRSASQDTFRSSKGIEEIEITTISEDEMKFKF